MKNEFARCFFETGMVILKNFLTPDAISQCRIYLHSTKKKYAYGVGEEHEFIQNDRHHPDTFSFYSPLCAEVLLLNVLPKVEDIAGIKLVPSYSYARTYYRGSFLTKHTDRKCSHFGISICVEKDGHDWPLFIIDKTGKLQRVELEPGDSVMFQGMQLEHYREKFAGVAQTQIFLFYVPEDERFTEFYFDRRRSLGALPAR